MIIIQTNSLPLHLHLKSAFFGFNKAEYRTSLVSISLPIKKPIFATHSNSTIKTMCNVLSNGRLYASWCQQPLSISSMDSKSKQRSATLQIQEALRFWDEYHTWHTPARKWEDTRPPLSLSVRCLCANCRCLSVIFASTSGSWCLYGASLSE